MIPLYLGKVVRRVAAARYFPVVVFVGQVGGLTFPILAHAELGPISVSQPHKAGFALPRAHERFFVDLALEVSDPQTDEHLIRIGDVDGRMNVRRQQRPVRGGKACVDAQPGL